MKHVTYGEEQTLELGKALGIKLCGGEIIALSGDLGAGKTVFTKGIALGLNISDTVVSPTFNLMNEYDGGRLILYHYDAYRLNSGREAEEAGLTEFFGVKNGVCVIEWWQNIADSLALLNVIKVTITAVNDNTREVDICFPANSAQR